MPEGVKVKEMVERVLKISELLSTVATPEEIRTANLEETDTQEWQDKPSSQQREGQETKQ